MLSCRNVVWERKKCDDTLPELLKNSCEGKVLLEGQIKQVMGNASSNRISQIYRAGKRKADNLQEELENTPQNVGSFSKLSSFCHVIYSILVLMTLITFI